MKNHSNKQLLFTILSCSLGTVAFGLSSCVDRIQGEIPTTKPTQQSSQRAATPTSTKKPTQQGFGRAPNPSPTATPTSTKKSTQQGFGRAPSPSVFPKHKTQ